MKDTKTHLSKLPGNKKLNFFLDPFYVLPKSWAKDRFWISEKIVMRMYCPMDAMHVFL